MINKGRKYGTKTKATLKLRSNLTRINYFASCILNDRKPSRKQWPCWIRTGWWIKRIGLDLVTWIHIQAYFKPSGKEEKRREGSNECRLTNKLFLSSPFFFFTVWSFHLERKRSETNSNSNQVKIVTHKPTSQQESLKRETQPVCKREREAFHV